MPGLSITRHAKVLTLGAIFVATTACSGCGRDPRSSEWVIRFTDDQLLASASRVNARIVRGGCDDETVVYETAIETSLFDSSLPPRLGPGQYALVADAVDVQCRRFAAGCTAITLPRPEKAPPALVVLEPSNIVAECDISACVDGRCTTTDAAMGVDSSTDGGDAGTCVASACPGKRCVGRECGYFRSCVELRSATTENGVYPIDSDGSGPAQSFLAYCEMQADGGGWTLLLKVDGTKKTFAYDQLVWSNAALVNPSLADLDRQEAKLSGFNTLPFTRVRLGMTDSDGVTRWIVVPLRGSSLNALFTASAGATLPDVSRTDWLSLVGSGALQPNCNLAGVNVAPGPAWAARVRLGIVANEQGDCDSPDSFLGFGASLDGSGVTTGNVAFANGPDGRDNPTFGYIMVQ